MGIKTSKFHLRFLYSQDLSNCTTKDKLGITEIENNLNKIIDNLKRSGAWENGNLKPDRNIATGNINVFGGTADGGHFIRTNNGQTEDDLAGGV